MWIKWTWTVKMGNYQFSKSRGACCRCKKLKKTKYKTADCKCGLFLFPSLKWPIWLEKCVDCIYILENIRPTSWQTPIWVFLQKHLSQTWGRKFFKLVILVGERGQRLKLGPCESKVKKFSVPLWQTANMLSRLLNCIHKR